MPSYPPTATKLPSGDIATAKIWPISRWPGIRMRQPLPELIQRHLGG